MNPPKLPSIFKHRGPKSFGFKPRYYDASKERLDLLKKNSADYTDSERRAVFQSHIRERWGESGHLYSRNVQVTIRRIVILIGLLVAVYWLLN